MEEGQSAGLKRDLIRLNRKDFLLGPNSISRSRKRRRSRKFKSSALGLPSPPKRKMSNFGKELDIKAKLLSHENEIMQEIEKNSKDNTIKRVSRRDRRFISRRENPSTGFTRIILQDADKLLKKVRDQADPIYTNSSRTLDVGSHKNAEEPHIRSISRRSHRNSHIHMGILENEFKDSHRGNIISQVKKRPLKLKVKLKEKRESLKSSPIEKQRVIISKDFKISVKNGQTMSSKLCLDSNQNEDSTCTPIQIEDKPITIKVPWGEIMKLKNTQKKEGSLPKRVKPFKLRYNLRSKSMRLRNMKKKWDSSSFHRKFLLIK